MKVTRRNLIVGAASLVPLSLIGGCVPMEVTPQQVTEWAQDSALIAGAIKGQLPLFQTIPGISSSTITAIGNAIDDIVAMAKALAGASDATSAQPAVSRILGDVNGILQATNGMTLPKTLEELLTAVKGLLPIMAAVVGIVGAAMPAGGMNPIAARIFLQAHQSR